jgi:hypothetical protein
MMDDSTNLPAQLYPSIDDWLDEIENFACRAERMEPEVMLWSTTAWQLATRAEAYRCATLCRTLAEDAATPASARDILMRLATTIWDAAPADIP